MGVLGEGHVGIGLKLPGIQASGGVSVGGGISIGGGIGVGVGGGGSAVKPSKWVKTPVDCSFIQDLGKFAVGEFNKQSGNNLEFKVVFDAAVEKVDAYISHYLLILKAIDCLHRLLDFKAVVIEVKKLGGKPELKLESFEQIFV